MSGQIWVAVIAGAVVIGQVFLGNHLATARESRDLRAAIERDIDILRKLRPGTYEARVLEHHVSRGIARSVKEDEMRFILAPLVKLKAPTVIVLVLMFALAVWQSLGMSETVRPTVDLVTWFVTGLAGILIVMALVVIADVLGDLWPDRRAFARDRTARDRRNRVNLTLEALQLNAATEAELDARRDEIIGAFGQEHWDELERGRIGGDDAPQPTRRWWQRRARGDDDAPTSEPEA
ncbi:MAG: hypothetical protein KDB70_18595 [Mycobacterium sp.]|nr:hypothetical protein [Mycobacterium sp.]